MKLNEIAEKEKIKSEKLKENLNENIKKTLMNKIKEKIENKLKKELNHYVEIKIANLESKLNNFSMEKQTAREWIC